MRKDLNKLLCEHERYDSRNKFGNFRHVQKFSKSRGEECEDLPQREGMKARHNTRSFGENLSPLVGFVRTNVGRPWDKAYSELCSTFDKSSVINQHIIQHLFDYVDITCVEMDGHIYTRSYSGALQPMREYGGSEFYVHPRTGILLKNRFYQSYKRLRRQRDAERAAELMKDRRIISDTLELRRKDDKPQWYLCEIAPVPEFIIEDHIGPGLVVTKVKVRGYVYEGWSGQNIYYGRYYDYAVRQVRQKMANTVYVKSYKTASHKELKKYGVISGK